MDLDDPHRATRRLDLQGDQAHGVQAWRAPIGWSNLIVSALSASGPLERRSPVQVVDTPERYAA